MHDRFGPCPVAGFRGEADQVAIEIAPYRQDRVGQQMDGDLAAIELVGDRIDQERHVVVDDLHHRMAALEAVVGGGGIEHPHLGHARQAASGEGEQGGRRSGVLVERGARQILVGDAAEQPPGELGSLLAARLQRGGANRIEPVDTGRQHGSHGVFALPIRFILGGGCYDSP